MSITWHTKLRIQDLHKKNVQADAEILCKMHVNVHYLHIYTERWTESNLKNTKRMCPTTQQAH